MSNDFYSLPYETHRIIYRWALSPDEDTKAEHEPSKAAIASLGLLCPSFADFSRRDLFDSVTLTPENCDRLRLLLEARSGLGQFLDTIKVSTKDWRTTNSEEELNISSTTSLENEDRGAWLRRCLKDVWQMLSSDALRSGFNLTLRLDGPDTYFGGDLSQFESFHPDEADNWEERIEDEDEDAIKIKKATSIMCGWEGSERTAKDALLPGAVCVTRLYLNQAILDLDNATYYLAPYTVGQILQSLPKLKESYLTLREGYPGLTASQNAFQTERLCQALVHHPPITYSLICLLYPLLDCVRGASCTPYPRISRTSDDLSTLLRTQILPTAYRSSISDRGHYGTRLSPSLFTPATLWPNLRYLEILHSPVDALGNWLFDIGQPSEYEEWINGYYATGTTSIKEEGEDPSTNPTVRLKPGKKLIEFYEAAAQAIASSMPRIERCWIACNDSSCGPGFDFEIVPSPITADEIAAGVREKFKGPKLALWCPFWDEVAEGVVRVLKGKWQDLVVARANRDHWSDVEEVVYDWWLWEFQEWTKLKGLGKVVKAPRYNPWYQDWKSKARPWLRG